MTPFRSVLDLWWQEGPERGHAALARAFQRASERGHLNLDDPLRAAEHFNWLVLSIPLNAAMFDQTVRFSQAELDEFADSGVRVFLAAYGTDRVPDRAA